MPADIRLAGDKISKELAFDRVKRDNEQYAKCAICKMECCPRKGYKHTGEKVYFFCDDCGKATAHSIQASGGLICDDCKERKESTKKENN